LGHTKDRIPLERIDPNRWRIPKSYNPEMRVPGMVYADDELIELMREDNALQQVVNVATLPGIVGHSLAMPDIHWDYGFPVGGVAATDAEEGVVSPGGIGFDINCGVRLLATNLLRDQIKGSIDRLADELFSKLPSGVGTDGMRKLTQSEMREVMLRGAAWAVEEGYGFSDDLEMTEENGCLAGANPGAVSKHAIERGMNQLGSLGSGNHFCEVQVVEHIYDQEVAKALGIGQKGQIVITIHCGSRAKELPLVYDVCHNIAKIEEYEIDGQKRRVCVHRKGAKRAFPAQHEALPEKYREVGQPVLVPRDMGRYSFVLVGAPGSMEQSFGSCCHGAGRRQSRTAAKKSLSSRDLLDQLAARGVTVRVHSKNLLTEEAPAAYKDAMTPIRMSFSLAYGNEKDSRQRSSVAVTVHAFNIF
jgi:RNA-splicing ligase RtcB